MDRGTYAAASGGLLQFRKLEIQNNNLANINTAGFKRQYLSNEVQGFDSTFAHALRGQDPYAQPDHVRTPGAVQVQSRTDFAQGPIKETGNPYDVALKKPNDFFVINTSEGTQYTRAGNFSFSVDGTLVTQDGFAVQGEGGAIQIPGPGATIGPDGTVRAQGQTVGRVQAVRFADPNELERVGSSRFKVPAGGAAPTAVDPELIPQSLEMANVSAVSSMVDLIVTNRAFEAYTRAAQTIDSMNQSAITQVGRR